MKWANIVVDDYSDFSEFSKEEAIIGFTDESVVESILDKQVKDVFSKDFFLALSDR